MIGSNFREEEWSGCCMKKGLEREKLGAGRPAWESCQQFLGKWSPTKLHCTGDRNSWVKKSRIKKNWLKHVDKPLCVCDDKEQEPRMKARCIQLGKFSGWERVFLLNRETWAVKNFIQPEKKKKKGFKYVRVVGSEKYKGGPECQDSSLQAPWKVVYSYTLLQDHVLGSEFESA